jgi:hypothetical protein
VVQDIIVSAHEDRGGMRKRSAPCEQSPFTVLSVALKLPTA